MFKSMILGGSSVLVAASCFLCGCSEDDSFNLTVDDLCLEPRHAEAFPTNAPKRIEEMADTDVIVAVNGYPLTKKVYEDLMLLRTKGLLEQKDANNVVVDKMMEEYRQKYIRNFQGQRMLVDAAFEQGVVTTNEVLAEATRRLRKSAKSRKMTVEKSLAKYGEMRKYIFQELFTSIVMDKFISKKIPPKAQVDQRFVDAVQKQVSADNAEAVRTNQLLRAHLQDWRNQIITNKLDFVKVAERFSQNPDPDGIWGEFEEGDMDDPGIEAKVFALRENAISDVLEDFNGYHLVKVLKVTPAEKNEAGRIVVRERRKLSHIYFEKMPEMMRQNDIKMTADLKAQMQSQAVNEYISGLSTNGATRIEYPNGTTLF